MSNVTPFSVTAVYFTQSANVLGHNIRPLKGQRLVLVHSYTCHDIAFIICNIKKDTMTFIDIAENVVIECNGAEGSKLLFENVSIVTEK